jgi:hypothetical protein
MNWSIAMAGKYSVNPDDIERFLKVKLAGEDIADFKEADTQKPVHTKNTYHLDKETIAILTEDRIDTGG